MTPTSNLANRQSLSVLFLCTRNSARSQIAEALMEQKVRRECPGRFDVASAGASPGDAVHPLAVATLAAQGIDWTGRKPRGIEAVVGREWDLVITVCDRAREACPVFPGKPIYAHWGMEDPAEVTGEADTKRAFSTTAVHLGRRIDLLLALPFQSLSAELFEAKVRAIAAETASPDGAVR